ncbi:overlapping protein [Erysimum latent virus]|uniref:Uncharacterized 48 kDa protein n=2 Tax=Erysimum latent virus TaxID=12152 RepID=Y48K_ELV|nr:overlapping protein [Erysimum latent virus]P35929.1 RecName: Full=Uncharacterized 48 kDa protein [Erysimum latent virus]AAC80554.1 overlapping protein [Erysimum latent virus]
MANGFSTSPRRPILHHSPRFNLGSSSRLFCESTPIFIGTIPLHCPKGTCPPAQSHGHSSLRTNLNSSPPRCPQNPGTEPSLQPLGKVLQCGLSRGLHETLKVLQTPREELPLQISSQLPTSPSRLQSVPTSQHKPAYREAILHPRLPDVFYAAPNLRFVRKLPKPSQSVRQPRRSSRKLNDRLVSKPRSVSVLNPQVDSPLHTRRALSRQLQSARQRPRLAENLCDPNSIPEPVRVRPGILGPSPFPSYREELSNTKSRFSEDKGSDFLPNPPSSNSSEPGLPGRPSQAPSCASENLRRPLHLHSSNPNSPHFRSRWIRKNSVKQARVQLGHISSLGQSPNLRPLDSLLQASRVLHATSVSSYKTQGASHEECFKTRSDGITSSHSGHLHHNDRVEHQLQQGPLLQCSQDSLAEPTYRPGTPSLPNFCIAAKELSSTQPS